MNPDPEEPKTRVLQEGDSASGTEEGDCGHDSRQHLGGDAGGNVYYRCTQCDAVLIQEGTVSWEERREAQKEALKEQEQGDNPLRGLIESQEASLFDREASPLRQGEGPTESVKVRLQRVIRRFRAR